MTEKELGEALDATHKRWTAAEGCIGLARKTVRDVATILTGLAPVTEKDLKQAKRLHRCADLLDGRKTKR